MFCINFNFNQNKFLVFSVKKFNILFFFIIILCCFYFQIPLGILEKDENITEQMIDVITHLQQYVPKRDKKLKPLLLGGDALSVERGEAAQKARIDAVTCEDRLDGFIWKSEDWHGHVISLQVYIYLFFLVPLYSCKCY